MELDETSKLLIKSIETALTDNDMARYVEATSKLADHKLTLPNGLKDLAHQDRDDQKAIRRRMLGSTAKSEQVLVENYLTMVWPFMKKFDPDASAPMLGYIALRETDWDAVRGKYGVNEGCGFGTLERALVALQTHAQDRYTLFDYRPLCHVGQVILGVTLAFKTVLIETNHDKPR